MIDVEAVRGATDERRDELVALVRELVSHPSENPKLLGDADAQARATQAEAACQERDGRSPGRPRHADRPLRGAARSATTSSAGCAGAGGGRSLILNGHVDVVPAGDAAAWPHDPWGGELEDAGACGAAGRAT